MNSTAIVAYTFQADTHCVRCIVKVLPAGDGQPFDGWALAEGADPMSTEANLSEIAAAFGIDREDESSFDSGDFPKVVFADSVNSSTGEDGRVDYEHCGTCGDCIAHDFTDCLTVRAERIGYEDSANLGREANLSGEWADEKTPVSLMRDMGLLKSDDWSDESDDDTFALFAHIVAGGYEAGAAQWSAENEPTEDETEAFRRGHTEANLWANTFRETDEDESEPVDARDFDVSEDAQTSMDKDADDFLAANLSDLRAYVKACELDERIGYTLGHGTPMDWAGHDFALTRAGHGAGFWDRGLGALGDRLTEASRPYGDVNLWVDEDGIVQIN